MTRKKQLPLMQQVFMYMNENPDTSVKDCTWKFRNEDWKNVRRCWHDWTRYIEPMRFLYFLMSKKFNIKETEKITKKEKERLRRIEKQLGLRTGVNTHPRRKKIH